VKEFLARSLPFESGLLHTFAGLSVRPGRVIREYVCGRRQRFTHPVAYILLSAAASVAVWPLREQSFAASIRATDGADDLLNAAFNQVTTGLETHPLFSALLVCCFFVPFQRVLFHGQITTADAFVYALFVFGQAIMLESLLTPFAALVTTDVAGTLQYVSTAALLYLVFAAAWGYFGPRPSTFLKTAMVIACALLGLLVVVMLAALGWYLVLLVGQGAAGQ
jgi:hypothetical protein